MGKLGILKADGSSHRRLRVYDMAFVINLFLVLLVLNIGTVCAEEKEIARHRKDMSEMANQELVLFKDEEPENIEYPKITLVTIIKEEKDSLAFDIEYHYPKNTGHEIRIYPVLSRNRLDDEYNRNWTVKYNRDVNDKKVSIKLKAADKAPFITESDELWIEILERRYDYKHVIFERMIRFNKVWDKTPKQNQ